MSIFLNCVVVLGVDGLDSVESYMFCFYRGMDVFFVVIVKCVYYYLWVWYVNLLFFVDRNNMRCNYMDSSMDNFMVDNFMDNNFMVCYNSNYMIFFSNSMVY